jgi:hypothetical protein
MSHPPSLIVEPALVPELPAVETPALLPLAPEGEAPLLPADDTPALAPVPAPEEAMPLDCCCVGCSGVEEHPASEDTVRVNKDKVVPSVEFRMSG